MPPAPAPSSNVTINMGGQFGTNTGAIGVIPGLSALYTGCDAFVAPGAVGDMALQCEIPRIAGGVPDPGAGWALLCYDHSFKADPGVVWKPIVNKFNPVDHYVRQRPDNKLSLTAMFVNGQAHLQRLRGIPLTLALCVVPDGMGVFSEIQVYADVMLNVPPMAAGSDGNASIEISAEGSFSWCGIFTGVP
jgi:hypothetical protein